MGVFQVEHHLDWHLVHKRSITPPTQSTLRPASSQTEGLPIDLKPGNNTILPPYLSFLTVLKSRAEALVNRE